MKKVIIIGILSIVIAVVSWMVLFNMIAKEAEKQYKEYKSKPDTTITIKNGIADTLITIKR